MHPSLTLPQPAAPPATGLRAFGRLLWSTNWPLTLLAAISLALLALTLVGLAVDPRTITGAPAWLKPFKFAVSVTIYSLTLAWMLSYVRGHRRWVALAGHLTTWSLVGELVIITAQVVRGRASHFNVSGLDGRLFGLMGGMIVVVFLMGLLAGALLLRQRLADAALGAGLRWGMAAALLGMGLAFIMTSLPTAGQVAAMEAGGELTSFGAHSVGVEDGGPGLPLVGWSTVGGDLRVAHFIGLHGLQALPLAALALGALTPLDERRRVRLVRMLGLGYLGLTLLAAWQALRGQPVIAPDWITLAAGAGLLAVVAASAWWAVRRGASGAERQRIAAGPRP
jgi:hypothetical protein